MVADAGSMYDATQDTVGNGLKTALLVIPFDSQMCQHEVGRKNMCTRHPSCVSGKLRVKSAWLAAFPCALASSCQYQGCTVSLGRVCGLEMCIGYAKYDEQ